MSEDIKYRLIEGLGRAITVLLSPILWLKYGRKKK